MNTPFLQLVADDIRRKTQGELQHSVVIFPNRRAGLFLDDFLTGDTPCWSPRYMTIAELFRSLSPLTPADPIDVAFRICSLYHTLSRDDVFTDEEGHPHHGSEETPDSFYGWAERLLTDFEDIDKSMAPAAELLKNVTAYRQIKLGEEVEDKVRDKVRQFFGQLTDKAADTLIKQRFMRLWNHLLPLYTQLNADLLAEGLAYDGALQRRVVEALEAGETALPKDIDTYYFVGFNALDGVEKRLFSLLKKAGKARFYWDYDLYYTADAMRSEAGMFLRENILRYGSELPEEHFRAFSAPKKMEIIAAPTENAQAYYAAQWLSENLTPDPRDTAVVLCNEELLEPILHALPPEVSRVNITKGLPLAHTPAYTFVNDFFSNTARLQTATAQDILATLSEKLETKGRENNEEYQNAKAREAEGESISAGDLMLLQLYNEAWFQAFTLTGRFLLLSEKPYFSATAAAAGRLLLQTMRQTSIPFHGEPAEGLQVMGVLETRCLDFKHVLMLSAQEGMMPRAAASSSFIPYPIRTAFGLPDTTRQTAVFAYYFYRLLQRAERVTFLYNNTADGTGSGEMSRFLLQLMLQSDSPIDHAVLSMPQQVFHFKPRAATKPADLFELLNPLPADGPQDDDHRLPLSPSSLNMYLECPLRFYFHRVLRLRAVQRREDGIQANDFGSIFHDAAEMYYKDCMAQGVTNYRAHNGAVLAEKDHKTLLEYIRRAFVRQGFPEGDAVVRETVLEYLIKLLRYDASYDELQLLAVEEDACLSLPVVVDGEERTFRVGGRIDRLDICRPRRDLPAASPDDLVTTLRILDYKTGSHEQSADTIDQIFGWEENSGSKPRPSYFFQTYLYCLTQRQRAQELHLPQSAALFYPHKSTRRDYDPWIGLPCPPVDAKGHAAPRSHVLTPQLLAEFQEKLEILLEEIFDPETDFEPCCNADTCRYCDFRCLCGLPSHPTF